MFALLGIAIVGGILFALGQFIIPIYAGPDAVSREENRPRTLPEDRILFGRHSDLDVLLEAHKRDARDVLRRSPRTLLIHGMTGVGKSALALRLAHSIAPEYPDGQLYAKMETVNNERRDPGEILGVLLGHLGRFTDIPDSTEERMTLFRSKTARKRILFLLDGARDESQVGDLLPSGTGCGVIVTSRRNLGSTLGATSYYLKPPAPLDAARIVRHYLPPNETPHAEIIARVVDMCGCLPMAIRAACERAREADRGLADVAANLEARRNRLAYLARPSRNIGARIKRDIIARLRVEYVRLLPRERRAFAMLALVKTPTFVPWVLQPLLDIGPTEASSLLAALSTAQLITESSSNQSKFPRYEFNELFRVFAEDCLDRDIPAARASEAVRRLRLATLACCEKVISLMDGLPASEAGSFVKSSWLPDTQSWESTIAEEGDYWVKAEFLSLIDAIFVAAEGRHQDLCWRIARRLVGCSVPEEKHSQVEQAFSLAAESVNGQDAGARERVQFAYATHLVSRGLYAVGLPLLSDIARQARNVDPPLTALAHRYCGEAFQCIGDYAVAERELAAAQQLMAPDDRSAAVNAIQILLASNRAVTTTAKWQDDIAAITTYSDDHQAEPDAQVKVALADAAVRRRRWNEAITHLDEALAVAGPGTTISIFVEYKRAMAFAERMRVEKTQEAAETAVRQAARAVAKYRAMGNLDGEIRARAVLAEAHLGSGNIDECSDQIQRAWTLGRSLGTAFSGEYGNAARASLWRLEGQVKIARAEYSPALSALNRAIDLYTSCGMRWERALSQLYLGQALRHLDQPIRALCVLHAALWAFDSCGDKAVGEQTWAEIHAVQPG